jgi:nucleoside diphosphate kinase
LVLFSPDATLTGRHRLGLCLLASELPLRFEAFRWARLGPADVDRLYAENRRARGRGPFDDLVDDLFGLGWSLACWARPVGPVPAAELVARLARWKGPSDPSRARPHHLRARLGARNSVMNLVHTSDTLDSARREAELVFGAVPSRPGDDPVPLPPSPPDLPEALPALAQLALRCEAVGAVHG